MRQRSGPKAGRLRSAGCWRRHSPPHPHNHREKLAQRNITAGLLRARGYRPASTDDHTSPEPGALKMHLNGLLVTGLVALGVVIAWDRYGKGAMRTGS